MDEEDRVKSKERGGGGCRGEVLERAGEEGWGDENRMERCRMES